MDHDAPRVPEGRSATLAPHAGLALRFFTRAGLLAAAGIVLFTGCSVREELTIAGDGSGEATLQVALHPILMSYMNDLTAAMTGVEGEYAVFDLDLLRESFAERPGVTLERLRRPSRGNLELEVSFDNISDVLAREGADDVLTLEPRGANRELTVRLDREAVRRFLEFAPEESLTMAQYLLPPADGSVSREEFREEMAWALEEYADRAVVERVLDESEIVVRVIPRGRIVSQRGGTVEGDAVVFRVPILELLTLPGERSYSLVFAP